MSHAAQWFSHSVSIWVQFWCALSLKTYRKLYGVDEKVDGKATDEIKGKEWFVLIRALCIGKKMIKTEINKVMNYS